MNCPHCSAPLAVDAKECGQCRFSTLAIRSILGAEWVRLERLTDHLSVLSLKEQRHVEIILDEFERRFPQCFFAVYLGAMPQMITSRDLGFWLINHGAFHTQQMAKRNDFGCALVIDTQRSVASLTLGYALEAHVTEGELNQLLIRAQGPLSRHRYGLGIERIVNDFGKKLKSVATRSLPGNSLTPNPHGLDGLGLQTLRAAHRPARPSHKS
ncbi:hypothetical protein HNQ64_003569 [Prosthecobacter dejongeii]|uniref:TPM domain-containing protein n=1 Tax=Prosthecobacter dejongeii TaxID=48465 RepID=A0A7W7YNL2_9BACT|nr:hypothetical protein [Prosthecobacter dejongeii]